MFIKTNKKTLLNCSSEVYTLQNNHCSFVLGKLINPRIYLEKLLFPCTLRQLTGNSSNFLFIPSWDFTIPSWSNGVLHMWQANFRQGITASNLATTLSVSYFHTIFQYFFTTSLMYCAVPPPQQRSICCIHDCVAGNL